MNKTSYFTLPKDVTHGRGYVYSLQYHIVWVTKYRKPIFVGAIEQDVKNHLLKTLKSLDMDILAMEIMPDHIHLLVDCKPQLWGGYLWNPSYFVATVSDRTLEQVKSYIDNQKTK